MLGIPTSPERSAGAIVFHSSRRPVEISILKTWAGVSFRL